MSLRHDDCPTCGARPDEEAIDYEARIAALLEENAALRVQLARLVPSAPAEPLRRASR